MGRREATEKKKGAQATYGGIDASKIAARAYARYLDRQREGASGDHLSDWYAAERELKASGPSVS